jgi:hypothetical protein
MSAPHPFQGRFAVTPQQRVDDHCPVAFLALESFVGHALARFGAVGRDSHRRELSVMKEHEKCWSQNASGTVSQA